MTLYEALDTLGLDPTSYFAALRASDRHTRMKLAQDILERAKKTSRILLAQHHPDKGGDPAKFRSIGMAYGLLEKDTNAFIVKMKKIIEEREAKRESQVLITIK